MLDAHAPALADTPQIQKLPHRSIVSLSAFNGQSEALQSALGLELPRTPRRIDGVEFSLLWSGPNAWLAISENPALFQEVSTKAGSFAAITEQSDGRFLLRVSGPDAHKILGRCVPIDLHPGSFGPDTVALTLAAHIGVTIWREEQNFILACFRSYAGALHHALVEAAAHLARRG